MQFENFNTTLFRGFFGNEIYDSLKDWKFLFKVVNEPVTDWSKVNLAKCYEHENIVGTKQLVLEYNMLAVTECARKECAITDAQFANYRRGILVHEVVHLAQMLKGRLKMDKGDVIFDGVRYSVKRASHWKYLQFPWEVEAFVTGYTVTYGMSEQEAIEFHNKKIHDSRPWYICLRDFVKAKTIKD